MGAKVLSVALFAGLSLLSAYVSAQDELPAGCTRDQFNVCFVGFIQHDVLMPLTTFTRNQTAERKVYEEQLARNPEHYRLLCDTWKDSFDCLRPLEMTCKIGTEYESFNELFPDLTSDIDRVQTQNAEWQMSCSSEMMCSIKMKNCSLEYPTGEDPDLTNPAVCMEVKHLYECLDSESHCRAYLGLTKTLTDIKRGVIQCESTLTCPEMLQCYTNFGSTPPKESGLNGPTCFAYRDYTQCAKDAIASCSDVDILAGGVQDIPVTTFVTQACTAMGQDGISAIYDCDNFTQCIDKEMDVGEFLYPEHFCRTTQAVMSCAFQAVKDWCEVDVNNATKEAFLSQMKELMLDAQAVGCGMAHFSGMACSGVEQCTMTAFAHMYDDDEQEGEPSENVFDVTCMEIQNYTSCADSKVKMCEVDGPQTMPDGGVAVPELDELSDITMEICAIMQNTDFATCPELLYCVSYMEAPAEDKLLIMNGYAWCGYIVHVVECAHGLTRTCTKTNAQKAKIAEIYDDLLDMGCPDTYGHKEVTTPTSGALPQIAVGWMGMLLPLLFCWIM